MAEQSTEWCAERLAKLEEQNKQLQEKIDARKHTLRDVLDENKVFKENIREIKSKDGPTLSQGRLNDAFVGDLKQWNQGGRHAFMGISHVIKRMLPKPVDSRAHRNVPPGFLESIESAHAEVNRLNTVLKKKSDQLRVNEAELERINESRRNELRKIVDLVGLEVFERICDVSVDDSGNFDVQEAVDRNNIALLGDKGGSGEGEKHKKTTERTRGLFGEGTNGGLAQGARKAWR
eukprot:g4729.t1